MVGASVVVGAVVVTFQPDLDRLEAVLAAVSEQVDVLVVVDNGSDALASVGTLVARHANATLVELGENRGIAAALNAGVDRLREERPRPAWILTLDQDTVISRGAVAELLAARSRLGEAARSEVGILAMSRAAVATVGTRRRAVARWLVLADLGEFVERRFVITSGNLVDADVFSSVRYEERFFIDNVDTKFSIETRRSGRRILELRLPTMDHRLGRSVVVRGRSRVYEPPQRLYYVARNAFTLVRSGDLPLWLYLRDVVGLSRVHVALDGPSAVLRCIGAVALGILDSLLGRFGRREYRFLSGGTAA